MFDGRNYNQQFDDACQELAFTKDADQIRRTLIGVEWVLEEAIRGVFFVQSLLLSVIVFGSIGFLLNFNSMGWQTTAMFFAMGIAFFC